MQTIQTPESQAIAAISPAEALYLLASGQDADLQGIDRLKKELHVQRQKGTATLLACIKRFDSLDAFVTADNAARDKARNAHRATEGKALSEKALLKLAVDPTYLTGCDQVRSAAGTLGWEAVQQATSIGSLYATARAKKSGSKAKGEQVPAGTSKPDTMERDEIPLEDNVHNAICDLAEALSTLPDAMALAIIADAIAAAARCAATVPVVEAIAVGE